MPFNEDDAITITFQGSSINEASWGVTDNALYLWAWSYDLNDANAMDCPTNGTWDNSNEANRLTYNSVADTYTISITPTTFYSRTGIGKIGFLIKAKDGTGDKKSQDIYSEVGVFSATLTNPAQNSTTILTSGSSLNITATNTNGDASYTLKANGATVNTNAATSNYSFTHTNITSNQNYELDITQGTTTIVKSFAVVVNPNVSDVALPNGVEEGINYVSGDNSKVILVLDAPYKDYVYVAGSFNNWQPDASYAMHKDPSSTKFWIELTGLTAQQIETYQYWVVDESPISGSPSLVKTADPYSTLVLSPYDDPDIPSSSFPNLPAYPGGQERAVTVLETGKTPYSWQVTNFSKPKKEDLVIYEVLLRDFDADRNFQDLIDRISYFKNLNVNAIELMPVMEFEGNYSWGYNTDFHMALDKFYGTEDKFKELIDVCHQNGIAVILDVALNHAYGRNPMVRMWMDDPDGDGWGGPSSENPYFNQTATHAYSVGYDFNHQQTRTQNYVERVEKHWIEDFHIDGFRWDLTKGFTQNCTAGDTGCTDSYQQDRVDVLKMYTDYAWSLDATHYTIFEHLGSDSEEQQWANYRVNETIPKGVMMWGNMNYPYTQIAEGYSTDGDISRVGYESHGFTKPRLVGYAESHDEERVLYSVSVDGNPNVNDARTFINRTKRMSTVGAALLTIPGPKMIWHFGDLGMENSIYTCEDGSVNLPGGGDGDCKLATKPQPQWTDNWLNAVPERKQIYDDWARINALKINEPVFEGNYSISPYINNVRQRIYIWTNTNPSSSLEYVVVLCNFSVADLDIPGDFPYT